MFTDATNSITLFESTCPKTPADLFAILVHEFNHYLQFREQLISEEIGLEGLIEAHAEKLATIPPFSQHIDRDILAENTALQIFYSDQQLAPNTQALLDQLAQGKIQKNLKSSPNRLRAKAYNENKKTYINREESLERKGDYSDYRNQLLEQESYALEEALRQVFKDTIPPPSAR
ncbi:MAG: hypothetical protein Q4B28_03190 [bacterium]|nr:hypothetical protein [bacterium]